MAGFFYFSKPPVNHAEKVLRDELTVLGAAEAVVNERREAALRALKSADRELATLHDRELEILHALNSVLTPQAGTA